MEVHLVADTNLFFECKALDQLPWQDLGFDTVVILLTKPVLDEIDKHKKATGRTRSRALEIFGQVRSMLTASTEELEIRASAPRVLLRRSTRAKPDDALKDELDYSKTDERLVGIVSTLTASTSGHLVKLFTDDTGPAATADGLNVPYLMIDESWRRPASESTEAKKIKELEKDLATYRAQEPTIVIGRCEGADDSNHVGVSRTIATPLSADEVNALLETLRQNNSPKTDFTPPSPSTGDLETIEYSAPSAETIADYQETQYPQWIERCAEVLRQLHEGRDVQEAPLVLRWSMSNDGTRPASQVRVEFEAKGPLLLRRSRPKDEDDGDEDAAQSPTPAPRVKSWLPSPPKPPAFERRVTRFDPPVVTSARTGTDLTALNFPDSLGDKYKSLTAMTRAFDAKALGLFPDHISRMAGLMDAASSLRHAGVFDQAGIGPMLRASAVAIPSPRIEALIPSFNRPPRHDPEAFYFDQWSADTPVKEGALTCDLWRHHTEPEVFELEVQFTGADEGRGTVECTVHAENLTKPQQERAIVSRTVRHLSLADLAAAMVAECK